MSFNSIYFPLFLLIVGLLYFTSPKKAQNTILLLGSFVFYGWWDWRFLFLMGGTIFLNYYIGIRIEEAKTKRSRDSYLLLSLLICLGALGYFKYANFFADGFTRLLSSAGLKVDSVTLNVILPVGISFYTFQALSYVIDIKRGAIKASRNLIDFALYVSFFPQLVAGPIERASHFLPQVESARPFRWRNLRIGAWLILLGYFKKAVVADNCAVLANSVFNSPEEADGFLTMLGVYAFAFQIYGDFSGYSDIARGLARWFGFDLMVNFRRPYFSKSPQDFWQRWHISLSSWLRDYLYIPLGGNRKGAIRTYVNLATTMLLGGLWHGANYNFILWGGYQGMLLIVHRFFARKNMFLSLVPRSISSMLWILTFFHITCVGWVFFRVNSVRDVPKLISNLLNWDPANLWYALPLAIYILPLFLLDSWFERSNGTNVLYTAPIWTRRILAFTLIILLMIAGNWKSNEFIYFQF
jgi:alginate O-acetyltransferase complex protein AlgI